MGTASLGDSQPDRADSRASDSAKTRLKALGIENAEDKGDYLKKCGQSFWAFISGDEDLYTTIIEPLGHRAKERNEEFQEKYGKVFTRFTKEFTDEFCESDCAIDWKKLLSFNSGRSCETVE